MNEPTAQFWDNHVDIDILQWMDVSIRTSVSNSFPPVAPFTNMV